LTEIADPYLWGIHYAAVYNLGGIELREIRIVWGGYGCEGRREFEAGLRVGGVALGRGV